jgi:anti-sigma regulatory factor (Ser/Thr protein kinase)
MGDRQRNEPAPLQLRLQTRPDSVRLLRERVRLWLEAAGATKQETFEVLLATTEAFANAVEHPQEPTAHLVDVEGTITDQAVTIAIRDYGTWQSNLTRKEQGGFGQVLMEKLMDGVRVECSVDGTTVTMRRRLQMR